MSIFYAEGIYNSITERRIYLTRIKKRSRRFSAKCWKVSYKTECVSRLHLAD